VRRWCLLLVFALIAGAAETAGELQKQAMERKSAGDAQGALALYQRAAKLDPRSASIEDEIGFLLAVMKRTSEAKEHFQRAIELQPRYAPPHYHLGVLYWLEKDPNNSIPLLQAAARLDPKQFDYRYRLGVAFRDVGHYTEASQELKADL
jgi:superkiller protein 3